MSTFHSPWCEHSRRLRVERKLRHLSSGLTIQSSKDYAPNRGDPDYVKGSDVPWIRRFARAGGQIIISGDTDMMWEPHERLALIEERMVVIFFGSQWSHWKFFRKCALLLHWWPVIAAKVNRPRKKGAFWRVPTAWPEEDKGKLQRIPTEDRRLLRIERQRSAQPKIAAERKSRRRETASKQRAFNFGD
jgi:PIN like domain